MTVELRYSLDSEPEATLSPRGANVAEVMPAFDAIAYPMLRLVDPYDDTVFNSNQMIGLIPELQRLLQETEDPVLPGVIKLAERCRSRGGYLVFIGD